MKFDTVAEFSEYFEKVRYHTRRVIEAIPPEKIEWTYGEGKFTLGDLVRHIGCMFAENVKQRQGRYPGHKLEDHKAEDYKSVLEYLDHLHAESMEIFGNQDLKAKCETPAGTSITVWEWLRSMIEREIHHRGQIYLMLGMLGAATPRLYGLTSEEIREKSLTD